MERELTIKNFRWCMCLRNSARTLNLGVLACDSGSVENIFIQLQALLDEYNARRSVKMIISDTTTVNTGHRNSVVAGLQRQFRQKGPDEPQFIDCQHHILDLILRHFLESFFPTESRSPNINYQFVEDVLAGYENLQKSYSGKEKIPRRENQGWRDDFRFLFELCEAYNFYQKERK